MNTSRIACMCALCASFSAGNLHAADADDANGQETFYEELVVTAHPLSSEGLAQPTTVLEGDELNRALAGTLGEKCHHFPLVKGCEPAISGLNRRQGKHRSLIKNMSACRLVHADVIGSDPAIEIKIATRKLNIAVMGWHRFRDMHMCKLCRGEPGYRNTHARAR